MYSGNASEIMSELEEYKDMFGETFPLLQALGDAEAARKEIKQCIAENKSAVEMWPDKYGRCDGKFI